MGESLRNLKKVIGKVIMEGQVRESGGKFEKFRDQVLGKMSIKEQQECVG